MWIRPHAYKFKWIVTTDNKLMKLIWMEWKDYYEDLYDKIDSTFDNMSYAKVEDIWKLFITYDCWDLCWIWILESENKWIEEMDIETKMTKPQRKKIKIEMERQAKLLWIDMNVDESEISDNFYTFYK